MKMLSYFQSLLSKKWSIPTILLKKLPKRFLKKSALPAPKAINNSKLYDKILNSLKKERIPLSIQFEHGSESFISMVLDVDANHQFIIIDEFNSPEAHHLACQGRPFIITAKESGIFIFFQSRVLDFGTIDGISFYRLAFPSHIEYMQRRASSRMQIPSDIAMSADFLVPGQGIVRAHITDISLTGMCLNLPRNVKSIFDKFSKIEHCRIVSPFMPAQEFTLDIKYCGYESGKQKTVLGCQFHQLDNVGLKFLSTLVMHLHPTRNLNQLNY